MRVGKVVRDDASAGIERNDAERMEEVDGENPDFQRVAWLGALDEDRPGHGMYARAPLGDTEFDGLQRLRNLRLACPCQPESLQSACDHRLDPYAIARGDPQHRRHAGVVVTPMHMLGRQREIVRARLLCPRGLRRRQQDETDREGSIHAVAPVAGRPGPANASAFTTTNLALVHPARIALRTSSIVARPPGAAPPPSNLVAAGVQ